MTKKVFLSGVTTGLRQWRVAAIVYTIQLALALTLGLQVFGVLQASIGHSLEIGKLLENYDHTVLTDFLNIHGASITPLIGQLRWLLLLWLLFSVFINGGLLSCAADPQQASWRSFWAGGAACFFPFLRIGLLMLALALGWTAAVWLPVAVLLQPALEYFVSEVYAVWGVAFLSAVWMLGLGWLFCWSVLSRLQHVHSGARTGICLRSGLRLFGRFKWQLTGALLAYAGLQLLLIAGYWLADAWIGMRSAATVAVFFAVQQALVFFRIQIRQALYAGIAVLAQQA